MLKFKSHGIVTIQIENDYKLIFIQFAKPLKQILYYVKILNTTY